MSTVPSMRDRRIFIELATKTSNPNFPPRVGLGGTTTKEQEADPRSWFGITRVVTHDTPFTPKDELTRFTSLFTGDAPNTMEQAAQRYTVWLTNAVQAWNDDAASPADVELLNWLLDNKFLDSAIGPDDASPVAKLVAEYRETEQLLKAPCTVNGMADVDEGYDYRLNIRGDYDQLGDFGHLGDQPSHPELLDHLAAQFIADGWSMKQLIRSIVLTETYRQAGTVDQLALDIDPKNRLWHHFSVAAFGGRSNSRCDAGRIGPTRSAVVRPADRPGSGQRRFAKAPLLRTAGRHCSFLHHRLQR